MPADVLLRRCSSASRAGYEMGHAHSYRATSCSRTRRIQARTSVRAGAAGNGCGNPKGLGGGAGGDGGA
eukprot:2447589-Prymnesium_polylepis.1